LHGEFAGSTPDGSTISFYVIPVVMGTSADRIVRRYLEATTRLGFEFDSPKELQDYLKEHPKADRAKHTVKKPGEGSKGKQEESKAPPAEAKKTEPTKEAPKAAPDEGKKPGKAKETAKEDAKGKDKDKDKDKGKAAPKKKKYKSKAMPKPKEASRVGIPGKAVLPPPKLPRLPGLSKDEQEIESRVNSWVESNPTATAQEFLDLAKKDNWVFETDGAKMLMPEWSRTDLPSDERGKPINPERAKFRATYNAIIHQAANAIAKRAFISRLDEIAKMPPEKRTVLVTSGGVAAGKGMALGARPDLKEGASATWDAAGEQNATENEWILEESLKRGIRPTFLFVHKDPKGSWVGAVERAKSIGRMVDARVFADSYAQGAKNFKEFYDKHKDQLGPKSFIFGNVDKNPDAKPDEKDPRLLWKADIVDTFPEAALDIDSDELYDYASAYMDDNKSSLPDYIYEGATIGRRIWGEGEAE